MEPVLCHVLELRGGRASAGAGIGPGMLRCTWHYQAYCTRVGGGPFPSEPMDIEAEAAPGRQMSRKGREIGTHDFTKRRCGWFRCSRAQTVQDPDQLA
ncbi:adenylosuccinate synthetase [Propionivibrio sp.]|uniref:adenylosuccinate synthetase n=1 Tax=Propionivibrio sp. TaxID=2212460 RepID=UPI00345C0F38|nr:adenylosuccinate synthetase [Propionivibrio sp.]